MQNSGSRSSFKGTAQLFIYFPSIYISAPQFQKLAGAIMKNKFQRFRHSAIARITTLFVLLFACCGFGFAQTCIVSSHTQTILNGVRESVYVDVTARSDSGAESVYRVDFSDHDWDKLWEARSKAEIDCARFTAEMADEAHSRQGKRLMHLLSALNVFHIS